MYGEHGDPASADFATFFEEAPDGFFFMMLEEPIRWDDSVDKEAALDYVFAHQRITRANRAMAAQYGTAPQDLLGKTPGEMFAHDLEQGRAAWRRLFDQGLLQTRTLESRVDGCTFWVEGNYVTLRDSRGFITGHFGSQRDVTAEVRASEALRISQLRLAEAQRIALIGHWDWNILNGDLFWSEGIYRILGLDTEAGPANYADFVRVTHPEDREMVAAAVAGALEGADYSIQHRILRPDGEVRWVHERGAVTFGDDGKPRRMLGTAQDVTEQKRTESGLHAALALNAGIVGASPVGISIYDETGQCIEANQAVAEMIGASRAQVLALNYHSLDSWRDSGLYEIALEAVASGMRKHHEITGTSSFGRKVSLACHLVPLEIGGLQRLLVMIEDVTNRKNTERRLTDSLREKDLLLREIHHRVKNNLQLIRSLLYLQMVKLPRGAGRGVFQESMDRIQVMAVLHETLYGSDRLGAIEVPEFLRALLDSLSESYRAGARGILVELEAQPRTLTADRAIPFGLLVNEIVSNSLKHAFPGERSGQVRVVGRALVGDGYNVSVTDDGVGLPEDIRVDTAPTLGLRLITSLAAQLHADLRLGRGSGTSYELTLGPQEDRRAGTGVPRGAPEE